MAAMEAQSEAVTAMAAAMEKFIKQISNFMSAQR
jgi:hypothetical protein